MIHVFIVNPKAGKPGFVNRLRNELSKMTDIEYYVFSSNSPSHEIELAALAESVFDEEQIRIYSVGGSGTFMKVLSGIKNLSNLEIACFPTGTNDYLKVFGDEEKSFHDIRALINGKVVKADYMEVNDMKCINSFSIGIDTSIINVAEKTNELRLLGHKVPYLLGTLYAIVVEKNRGYQVCFDDKNFIGKATEVYFGNGCAMGGSLFFNQNPRINSGMGFYRIFRNKGPMGRIPMVAAAKNKDFEWLDNNTTFGDSRTMVVRRTDGKRVHANVDGELYTSEEFTVKIVKEGLNLVIPREADYE